MLELARQLKESAQHLHALNDVQENLRQYTSRQEQFRSAAGQIQQALATWTILHGAGLLEGAPPDSVASALRFLAVLRRNAQQDPATLIRNDFSIALKNLRSASDELTQAAREAWAAYLVAIHPPLPEPVLVVFERQPESAEHVRSLRALMSRHAQLRATFPVRAEHVQSARTLAKEYQWRGQALAGANLSPDVAAFLEAAASGKAGLHMLTPDVLAWLREHRLTHAFVITLAPR